LGDNSHRRGSVHPHGALSDSGEGRSDVVAHNCRLAGRLPPRLVMCHQIRIMRRVKGFAAEPSFTNVAVTRLMCHFPSRETRFALELKRARVPGVRRGTGIMPSIACQHAGSGRGAWLSVL
jgi:hypothetical protein